MVSLTAQNNREMPEEYQDGIHYLNKVVLMCEGEISLLAEPKSQSTVVRARPTRATQTSSPSAWWFILSTPLRSSGINRK
ncbi:unnamed protein product [Coregonus sp. 'balchen']|nr:unnamed protein product [Coregonus sp. 'balchen']